MALTVLDTFTRADSASTLGTADTGQAWTALSGTWGIKSNAGYKPSANNTTQEAVIDSGLADAMVSCLVTPRISTSIRGLVLRATDVSNLLFVQLDNNADTISLIKRISGTNTSLASVAMTINTSTTYSVVATMRGTSINIEAGGAQRLSYNTSTGLETNTKHGLWTFESDTLGCFDNFMVQSLDSGLLAAF